MRKRLGVVLGLLIAVVLLAATAQAGTRGSKVTTVTLSGWSSGPDEDALLQQVVNNFNKSHPSIHGSQPKSSSAWCARRTSTAATRIGRRRSAGV